MPKGVPFAGKVGLGALICMGNVCFHADENIKKQLEMAVFDVFWAAFGCEFSGSGDAGRRTGEPGNPAYPASLTQGAVSAKIGVLASPWGPGGPQNSRPGGRRCCIGSPPALPGWQQKFDIFGNRARPAIFYSPRPVMGSWAAYGVKGFPGSGDWQRGTGIRT